MGHSPFYYVPRETRPSLFMRHPAARVIQQGQHRPVLDNDTCAVQNPERPFVNQLNVRFRHD
jgi:hypothetical protein